MAKGRGFRRQPKVPNQARIVKDIHDSWDDKFIDVSLAEAMVNKGALKEIDLGPSYPHSYMRI